MSYFHPLEVVGRASETQLQVGENLKNLKDNLAVKRLIFYSQKWDWLIT